jgi:hypothetical protein
MNYIIEYSIAGGSKWVQSDAYPDVYPEAVAQGILDGSIPMYYRMTPVPEPIKKPYRRHAAVTPLELRGAREMLKSAGDYIARQQACNCLNLSTSLKVFGILYDARLAVTRQLEAL